MATFNLSSLTASFAAGLDLSLFLQTRQAGGLVVYLGSPQTLLTLELLAGRLATRLTLCGGEAYFRDDDGARGGASALDNGWLNFLRVKAEGASLVLEVNGSVRVNETLTTAMASCPLQPGTVHFGKAPDPPRGGGGGGGRRRRRDTDPSPSPSPSPPALGQLEPFNGVLMDVELQGHKLDFAVRPGAQETDVLLVSEGSGLTLGAQSTLVVCNTSAPCHNGGTCRDVFFNDFQ